jgi:carboxyl-terminal processing protease
MLPASVSGPGMNMGFPDVCLTPAFPSPIPIPYPNMGMHAMAAPFCPTILLGMMPALNLGSIIPMTMGDEPGVANPMFMQMGMFTMGNPTVLLGGLPAITLTSTTTGNNMNNPVGAVLVPGMPTVLFGYLDGGGPRPPPNPPGHTHPGGIPVFEGDAVVASFASPGVGRIAIRAFSRGVAAAVHSAIAALSRGGLSQLLFDLRDNPGGELGAAVEIVRDLLPEGSLVAVVEDSEGDELTYRARGDAYPWPIVIQVNRRTASAAELFAGCLQAHGRAVVVGERTYGKGTAFAMVAGAFVEVGRFRLPNGAYVDGTGVAPDVAEPLT